MNPVTGSATPVWLIVLPPLLGAVQTVIERVVAKPPFPELKLLDRPSAEAFQKVIRSGEPCVIVCGAAWEADLIRQLAWMQALLSTPGYHKERSPLRSLLIMSQRLSKDYPQEKLAYTGFSEILMEGVPEKSLTFKIEKFLSTLQAQKASGAPANAETPELGEPASNPGESSPVGRPVSGLGFALALSELLRSRELGPSELAFLFCKKLSEVLPGGLDIELWTLAESGWLLRGTRSGQKNSGIKAYLDLLPSSSEELAGVPWAIEDKMILLFVRAEMPRKDAEVSAIQSDPILGAVVFLGDAVAGLRPDELQLYANLSRGVLESFSSE